MSASDDVHGWARFAIGRIPKAADETLSGTEYEVIFLQTLNHPLRGTLLHFILSVSFRGRHGFDVDYKTQGACRGTDYLVNPAVTHIVANDDNYALAA